MSVLRDLISRKSKYQAPDGSELLAGDVEPGAPLHQDADETDVNLQLTLTALQAKLREPDSEPKPVKHDADISQPPLMNSQAKAPGEIGDPARTRRPAHTSATIQADALDTPRHPTPQTHTDNEAPLRHGTLEQPKQVTRERPGLDDLPELEEGDTDRSRIGTAQKPKTAAPVASEKMVAVEKPKVAKKTASEPSALPPVAEATAMPPRQEKPTETPVIAPDEPVSIPAPSAGRSGRRAGRVKTRLLGFEATKGSDPFDEAGAPSAPLNSKFPVGWIVVINGPGRGTFFPVFNGVSQIGRGDDQAIKLDFGDTSISRSNHAAVAYDSEQRRFFLGHGGKSNLVRLNDNPVLSTERMTNNDLIRIGETTLRFVGLCNEGFDWDIEDQDQGDNAAIA